MPGVTVSYSGVHQAYQIARAADEAGMLERFYCSIYNAPNFVGGRLASLLGQNRLASRRVEGLDTSKVEEYPWPALWHELTRSRDWLKANDRFDRHVASRLDQSRSKVFVGVETCAHHSFEAARRLGMINVLDCPGVDAEFLDQTAQKAADEFGLSTVTAADSSQMRHRKSEERSLADVVLVSSEFQLRTMQPRLSGAAQVQVIPLWIDEVWQPPAGREKRNKRLRALFVGKISVRKGIPYLLEAAKACANKVELTLVGNVDPDIEALLKVSNVRVLSARPKADMQTIYQTHDVFVLPSLGDAFGLAALEAMACGSPVIISDHCGVPVPNPDWRVSAMKSRPIAERLTKYAEDRQLLKGDSCLAADFAAQYTAKRYRAAVRKALAEFLHQSQS